MNKITRKPKKTLKDKIKSAKGYDLTFDEKKHKIINLKRCKRK